MGSKGCKCFTRCLHLLRLAVCRSSHGYSWPGMVSQLWVYNHVPQTAGPGRRGKRQILLLRVRTCRNGIVAWCMEHELSASQLPAACQQTPSCCELATAGARLRHECQLATQPSVLRVSQCLPAADRPLMVPDYVMSASSVRYFQDMQLCAASQGTGWCVK